MGRVAFGTERAGKVGGVSPLLEVVHRNAYYFYAWFEDTISLKLFQGCLVGKKLKFCETPWALSSALYDGKHSWLTRFSDERIPILMPYNVRHEISISSLVSRCILKSCAHAQARNPLSTLCVIALQVVRSWLPFRTTTTALNYLLIDKRLTAFGTPWYSNPSTYLNLAPTPVTIPNWGSTQTSVTTCSFGDLCAS